MLSINSSRILNDNQKRNISFRQFVDLGPMPKRQCIDNFCELPKEELLDRFEEAFNELGENSVLNNEPLKILKETYEALKSGGFSQLKRALAKALKMEQNNEEIDYLEHKLSDLLFKVQNNTNNHSFLEELTKGLYKNHEN